MVLSHLNKVLAKIRAICVLQRLLEAKREIFGQKRKIVDEMSLLINFGIVNNFIGKNREILLFTSNRIV